MSKLVHYLRHPRHVRPVDERPDVLRHLRREVEHAQSVDVAQGEAGEADAGGGLAPTEQEGALESGELFFKLLFKYFLENSMISSGKISFSLRLESINLALKIFTNYNPQYLVRWLPGHVHRGRHLPPDLPEALQHPAHQLAGGHGLGAAGGERVPLHLSGGRIK